MRILIAGIDGYLGWPLAMSLANEHVLAGVDNLSRRRLVHEGGSQSAIPIADLPQRLQVLETITNRPIQLYQGDLTEHEFTKQVIGEFRPEVIVYLAEIPSAPFSMKNAKQAMFTQSNNVLGTLATLFAMNELCPDCHLLKLGTMGEYGTPKVDIPEGFFELSFRGKSDWMMFPRKAGSWYHQSKVHDTHNIEMACRIWGLKSTDIMQGVVYGTRIANQLSIDELNTRFDFDECFGTVINRFCAQAVIGMPLTPFGKGEQKRGFLPLKDSIRCLTLALENPPDRGEYRTFNQFDQVYSINEIAASVERVGNSLGLSVCIQPIDNPRIEEEVHEYRPDNTALRELGYCPSDNLEGEIKTIIEDLIPHAARIEEYRHNLMPKIRWQSID